MKSELLHSYSSNSLANLSRGKVKLGGGGGYSSGSNLARAAAAKRNNKKYPNNLKGIGNPTFVSEDSDPTFPSKDNTSDYGSSGLGASRDGYDDDDRGTGEVIKGFCSSLCRKKMLFKRFPVLKWSREYNVNKLIADIIAGLTIGLTILPQGLAYAKIAGLPPQYGLYSGFIPCFVYIVFGGTKVTTVGPTAIMSIVTLSYAQGKPPEYAVFLCLVTGLVTLLAGLLQLGFIVNFISTPVISGFTSAAALTICSTQIKPLLGLSFKADNFRETLIGTVKHIGETKYQDALLSLACILLLAFMQNLQAIFKCVTKGYPKMDRALWFLSTSRSVIVIVISTVIFSVIDVSLFPVEIVGDVPAGLPPVRPPVMSGTIEETGEEVNFLTLFKEDMSALIVLPILALIEDITIAKRYSGGGRVDASQELIAVGVCNIAGSFFSSIPVTGSFSRSVVNAASGAESPMGGIVTGTLVILALQFLTPYFFYIPNAALAAVIMSAVILTVDFSIAGAMWKSKKMDLIPWAATFLISLGMALEVGILAGVVISVVFLLFYASRPAIHIQKAETGLGTEFVIVGLDRSLVFPSVEYIRYMVTKSRSVWAKEVLPVVINCQHMQFADFSAAQGFLELFKTFNEKKHPLILWRAKPSIVRTLRSVMDRASVPFLHAVSDEELEKMIDEFGDDRPIEFLATSSSFTLSPTPSPTQDDKGLESVFIQENR